MFDFLKKKQTVSSEIFVTYAFPMPLRPEERHSCLEDRIGEWLQAEKLGEYVGGGTFLDDDQQPCGCDITLKLYEATSIARVAERFNELGAVKGSTWQVNGQENRGQEKQSFGENDCLALGLDMNLPDEVMAANDIGALYTAIDDALDGVGRWLTSVEQQDHYVLHLYGPSFDAMAQRLQPLLEKEALLQNAFVRQMA